LTECSVSLWRPVQSVNGRPKRHWLRCRCRLRRHPEITPRRCPPRGEAPPRRWTHRMRPRPRATGYSQRAVRADATRPGPPPGRSALGALGLAGRAQVLARLDNALGHGLLRLLQVRARVVDLLVAHVAVDLEHAVVV